MDSNDELRSRYRELLEDPDDARRLRLLRYLDAGYRVVHYGLVAPPQSTRQNPFMSLMPQPVAQESAQDSQNPEPHIHTMPPRRLGRYFAFIAVALLMLAVGVTLTFAAGILNLGKPTAATLPNPNFPLSGFHKAGPVLHSHGLPELLWIGTAWPGDASSDWERWPVIKALEQFGTLSNVGPGPTGCGKPEIVGGSRANPILATPCSLPTPDWTHARYVSRYVAFRVRDMLDTKGHVFQPLNSVETKLFNRYVRQATGNSAAAIGASINTFYISAPTLNSTSHLFPLLSIGGYLQTVTQSPFVGDLVPNPQSSEGPPPRSNELPFVYYLQPLSFDTVRRALATGKTPSAPAFYYEPATSFPSLVPDINAEANVITALICHADGRKPASVCTRPIITQLLRNVK